MPTKSQVLHTDPHKVLDLIDGWKTTVAALEQHAETYLGYVKRPGGSSWEGRTAEAAQERAHQDLEAVTHVRDAVDAAAQKIANTVSLKLMPPLANAKQIIENAESHAGVTVNEDLSITYTAPEGTSKETADANAKTVAAAEAELKAEAAKWWAAENEAVESAIARQEAPGLRTSMTPQVRWTPFLQTCLLWLRTSSWRSSTSRSCRSSSMSRSCCDTAGFVSRVLIAHRRQPSAVNRRWSRAGPR
jgi:hypothetical protein